MKISPVPTCLALSLLLVACDDDVSGAVDGLQESRIEHDFAEDQEDSDKTDLVSANHSKLSVLDIDGLSLVASVSSEGAPEVSPQLVESSEIDAMISGDGIERLGLDKAIGQELAIGAEDALKTGPGTFTFSIPALSCVAQGSEFSGDFSNSCGGGGTVRTNGDSSFPCAVRSPSLGQRTTYICELELPNGAQIDEVTAHGFDFSSDGYMEAAVWRTGNTTFAPNYISPTFGGNWQDSGLAASPGYSTFPIYLDTDAPHTVQGNSRYTIGFALEYSTGALFAYGFQVTYTIL